MKLLISLFFTFFALTAFSQAQAIKMKHYSWNNPQHHFNEVLTENGKALLDSIILETGFDTLQCDRLDYEKIIDYTSRKTLPTHSYKYLKYELYNGQFRKNIYQNFNGYDSCQKQRCILSFSTNYDNIAIVTLYIID
jgi:hypothetical protein